MVGIMIFTTIAVILRFFGHPIHGDVEITIALVVCVVYFGIAWCALEDAHVKVEIFTKWPLLDHIVNFLTMAVALFISVQSLTQAITANRLGIESALLNIPRAPFIFVTAYGFFTLFLALVLSEYKLITKKTNMKKMTEDAGVLPEAELEEVSQQ